MTTDNYMIIYENLPISINGFTMHNAVDDFYTIVLNSKMSHITNQKTLNHELSHINNDDFIKFKNVGQIEQDIHL